MLELDILEEYFLHSLNKINRIEKETQDESIIESVLSGIKQYDENNIQIFLDDLTKRLSYLYLKPISDTSFFQSITNQMLSFNFIEYISSVLDTIHKKNLLTIDSPIRDIFISSCNIIILYADDCLSFRISANKSNLLLVLIKIIKDNPRDNDLRNECVNYSIRALYNLTRLESELARYKELKVAQLLIAKLPEIECNKTKLCAILCIGWTLKLDEIKRQDELMNQAGFEEGVFFAFSLLDKSLKTDNNSSNNGQIFRCFLDQYGRLPFYWAYEIADGIGRWAKNDKIRAYVAKNEFMFQWLMDLYKRGNLIEKEFASCAINEFVSETNLLKLITENQHFLNLINRELNIDSDILKLNLTQIQMRVLIEPKFSSIDYLRVENQLPSFLKFNQRINQIDLDLGCLQRIYQEFKSKVSFYHKHESLLSEISIYIVENSRRLNIETTKNVLLVNAILIKIKLFIKKLMKISSLCSSKSDELQLENSCESSLAKCSSEVAHGNQNERVINQDYLSQIEIMRTSILSPEEYLILISYLMFESVHADAVLEEISLVLKNSLSRFKCYFS